MSRARETPLPAPDRARALSMRRYEVACSCGVLPVEATGVATAVEIIATHLQRSPGCRRHIVATPVKPERRTGRRD